MEHAIREISHDPSVYRWLCSNGIYTSCHDLITRILQFDCDGDQLNCVVNKIIISVAERNLKNHDIVPLYYAANDAPKEIVNRENIYIGLKRAHDCSGIGQISNNQCKLWNSDEPNYECAALVCY